MQQKGIEKGEMTFEIDTHGVTRGTIGRQRRPFTAPCGADLNPSFLGIPHNVG